LPVHGVEPNRGLASSVDTLRLRVNAVAGALDSASFKWAPKPSIRVALGFAFLVVFIGLAVGIRVAHQSTGEAAHLIGSVERQYEPILRKTRELEEALTTYSHQVDAEARDRLKDQATILPQAAARMLAAFDDYASLSVGAPGLSSSKMRPRLEAFRAQGLAIAELCRQRAGYSHTSQDALNTLANRAALAAQGFETGDQVYTRKSLAELSRAAGPLRTSTLMYFASPSNATADAAAENEAAFRTMLRAHADEFVQAPGRAWFELMANDLRSAARARTRFATLEQGVDTSLAAFEQSTRELDSAIESDLQRPAWQALTQAAGHARIAAERTEAHITSFTLSILGLIVAIALVILFGIAAPIRRLLEGTRRLARGALEARVPRGGLLELDELAVAFNDMAEALHNSQEALREHQAVLEQRIAQRTEELHLLAHQDSLTELPNRRELAIRLATTIGHAQAAGTSCALLYLDVDNFKTINDTLGHQFGDRVLRAIAARLLAITGKVGFLARLGGDEFTLVVPTVKSPIAVEYFMAHILREFTTPLRVDDRELLVNLSAGIALYPEHGDSVEALLRAADSALHDAKDKGRNGFQVYRAELLAGASHRFHTEQALRHAIANGDFLLHYQPEVSLLTKRTTVVEALLRWRRPDGRIVPAGEFIEIAEQSGLLLDLSDWLIRSALDAARDLRTDGWSSARVAINVSPQQLLAGQFLERVRKVLAATKMPADCLEVELTESALQTGRRAIETLHELRRIGVAVALDDFGTGYSTLKSIEELPLTRVKLDRSLVANIEQNPSAAAFALSCVQLCQSRGLTVTVEGIERAGQLDVLEKCGDIQLQGFLIARPAPLEDIARFVRETSARMAAAWPTEADDDLLHGDTSVTFLRHRNR
jgi:diguanylate cyclase (GGDEF)-like protein